MADFVRRQATLINRAEFRPIEVKRPHIFISTTCHRACDPMIDRDPGMKISQITGECAMLNLYLFNWDGEKE